ncbi:hypothetical protein D3C72_2447030 [compost metagenome]
MAIKFLADIRHGKLSGGALDKPDTEIIFQQGDPAAQPGARHIQFSGRSVKAALLHDFHIKPHIVEISHGRAFHFPVFRTV